MVGLGGIVLIKVNQAEGEGRGGQPGGGGIKPPSEPANQPGLVAGGVVEADREEEGGLFRINTTTDI